MDQHPDTWTSEGVKGGARTGRPPRGPPPLVAAYDTRVGSLWSPVKRREFQFELAESRRIVPEWTSTRTLGHRRGSRGGLELVDPPGDPPHWWPRMTHELGRFGRQ